MTNFNHFVYVAQQPN